MADEASSRSYTMQIDRKGVHFEKRTSTSIKIDPELWKEAKIESIRRGMNVSDLVEMALRSELDRHKQS